MIGDAQTHELPSNSEGFDILARFTGIEETQAFKAEVAEKLQEVATLTEAFFAPEETGENGDVKTYLERWRSFPALRSERAVASFKRLFPPMLESFQAAADPSGALNTFEQFLRGLPAGVQVFSLFEANPSLGRLIADICTASPALAMYLGRNAQVLDAVIGGVFFAPWPEQSELTKSLQAELAEFEDYESKLDATRRWQKEWHFRVGVHHLQGLISPEDAGAQYADLAKSVVIALLPVVNAHVAVRHGAAPGRGAVVVGMGSLGAGVLTSRSDLDLIVVYDAGDVEVSDGPRPLATRSYFARVTQTLVTALSAPTAEGRLYEVDMRLRPSGQSGPVATSFQSFESYQKNEAWVWEHLALTRAQPFAGDALLISEIEAVRKAVLLNAGGDADVRKETQEMRERLAQAGQSGVWDVKAGPGGAQDIDLFAQAASLAAGTDASELSQWLSSAVSLDWCSDEEATVLKEARALYWRTTQASRLTVEGAFDPESVGAGGVALLLRDTKCDSVDDLVEKLNKCRNQAKEVIDRVMSQG
jgi:glutamate-ammonia-ligase adenylyltransferase